MALQDLPLGIRQIAGIWFAHPFNIPHRVYSVGSAHKNLLLSESDQGEQHDRGTTEGHIPHTHFLRFTLLNKTRSKSFPVTHSRCTFVAWFISVAGVSLSGVAC